MGTDKQKLSFDALLEFFEKTHSHFKNRWQNQLYYQRYNRHCLLYLPSKDELKKQLKEAQKY